MVQTVTESSVQVALMPVDEYVRFWPQIEAELDKVPHIWEDYFTKDYLREVPFHQELMVWCTLDKGAVMMVIFAQFIEVPRGKGICFLLALGQGLDEALPQLESTYEHLGQVMECDFVEVRGRRGWLKKLPGFKEDYTVMSRQLRNFRVQ